MNLLSSLVLGGMMVTYEMLTWEMHFFPCREGSSKNKDDVSLKDWVYC